MPNHYQNIAICTPGYDFDLSDWLERHKETDLCSVVMPMPEKLEQARYYHDKDGEHVEIDGKDVKQELRQEFGYENWYDWANANWGTKWGTYHLQGIKLEGDGAPVILAFCSAWKSPDILDKIAKWLISTTCFERIQWIGFDPYDYTTKLLEEINA